MEKIIKKVILISCFIFCFICIDCINFASATESEPEAELFSANFGTSDSFYNS